MKKDLAEYLEWYANDALMAMTRRYGVLAVAGKYKADLVKAMARTLGEKQSVKRALVLVSRADRQALALLAHWGGSAKTRSFEHELLLRGLATPHGEYHYEGSAKDSGSTKFLDIIARLAAWGLVLSEESDGYSGATIRLGLPGRRLFIPDEVLALLPRVPDNSPDASEVAVSELIEARPEVLQRDLWLYWRFARREELAVTARGGIAKRQLATIMETLTERESLEGVSEERELGRTWFLRTILQGVGLLTASAKGGLAVEESPSFFSLPVASRVRKCYQAWIGCRRWNELRRVEGIGISYSHKAHRDTPAEFADSRGFIGMQLAKLPAGRWISFDYLIEQAELADVQFLFKPTNHRSIGYAYDHREAYGYANPYGWTIESKKGKGDWRTIEGGFIKAAVAGPLHWLGLVDLGYADGSAVAFRLTALGQAIVRNESQLSDAGEDVQPRVVVQPNFEIFAFDPIREDVLAELDRFADLVRADKAVEFRLTRESVYRAQQAGASVPLISSFLEKVSGRELPQNVRRTLEEWDCEHDRIIVRRNVGVLHAASAELLASLFAERDVAEHLDRPLGPGAASVKGGDAGVQLLEELLLRKGYMPAVEENGATADKTLEAVGRDGVVEFRQALPSIHTWKRLLPFAEELERTLRITAQSVQKAVEGGLSTEAIIATLAEVHRGGLPVETADRIKKWANHWGEAELGSVTFLRVKDRQVLAELMGDRRLGELLSPFTPDGAVALVRPSDIERLREVLTEKGITVQDELGGGGG